MNCVILLEFFLGKVLNKSLKNICRNFRILVPLNRLHEVSYWSGQFWWKNGARFSSNLILAGSHRAFNLAGVWNVIWCWWWCLCQERIPNCDFGLTWHKCCFKRYSRVISSYKRLKRFKQDLNSRLKTFKQD